MKLTARVPATSANLGPGFDSFGLALDLCNEVTLDTEAEPGVSWEGEGADELPTDGSDMVSRAIAATVHRQGRQHPGAAIPTFALHGVNRIPVERGLGSSSAAAVAGTALASALLGDAGLADEPYSTFAYAAELEGHPDNAAPAAYGGLCVIAEGFVHRLDVHPAIRPVLLIPEHSRVPTDAARRALPERVLLRDAVSNIGHGALVVTALTTGDVDLLRVALHDRLHEELRLSLVPDARDVLRTVRSAQIPACVSGSGPSLLAFDAPHHRVPVPREGWRVLRVPVRRHGIEVVEG
ncbi:MAG TPA: homoserine kinase [Actinomycetota bacterium]|nr:homoserine kinase [Actinomycetota bacterium]